MPKWLQPNTTVYQWKLRNKTAVEVSNHSKARLEFFLGMAIEFVLSQVFSTTLPEKVLQNSDVGRRSNYMAGTCLPLITL